MCKNTVCNEVVYSDVVSAIKEEAKSVQTVKARGLAEVKPLAMRLVQVVECRNV